MDDATFGLNECQRVFFTAGIRHILRPSIVHVSREKTQGVSPEELPDAYRKLLKNTEPGCATLWTYAELGPDLMGNASADRSRLLKNIIGNLAWPKGSISFWPFTVAENGRQLLKPDIFWLGVQALAPRSVIVFGQHVFEELLNMHEELRDFVLSQTIPFVWLQELNTIAVNGDIDRGLIDMLQNLKQSLS